jgi:hypothetical protein
MTDGRMSPGPPLQTVAAPSRASCGGAAGVPATKRPGAHPTGGAATIAATRGRG